MARIVEDHGRQRLYDDRGRLYFAHVFVLDCRCVVKIDESVSYNFSRDSLIGIINRTALAHNCDVIVERGEIRYMGLGVKIDPSLRHGEARLEISTNSTSVGFKAPEIKPPEPPKKVDPPRALTRWELLELD